MQDCKWIFQWWRKLKDRRQIIQLKVAGKKSPHEISNEGYFSHHPMESRVPPSHNQYFHPDSEPTLQADESSRLDSRPSTLCRHSWKCSNLGEEEDEKKRRIRRRNLSLGNFCFLFMDCSRALHVTKHISTREQSHSKRVFLWCNFINIKKKLILWNDVKSEIVKQVSIYMAIDIAVVRMWYCTRYCIFCVCVCVCVI